MTQQTFSVWAPSAERVGLWHDGTLTPMSRDGQWWSAVADVDPESGRYGYVVDGDDSGSAGDDVLPDPRAPRLPDGVHAAGAVDDATAFGWTDQTWAGRPIAGAVIYELHIGTFTSDGTFDAAIDRLAYLADLGVEFVEVMPVNGFNGVHNWGYDGVAWYAVHEPYGGPEGFRRFVDAAHAAGIGVILDVVYNHLGPSGNYLPRFGPYLTQGANTWGQSLNLDQADSDAVRAHIIDNALRWMRDFHVDGLRLDAVHALVDHTAIHLLEELAVATDALATALGRPLSLIAESDLNDPRLVTARGDGGYGLAAQWDDDVHHAVHTAVSGERQGYYADFGSLDCLATALTRGFFHAMTYSSFRRRRHGRPIDPDRVAPSQMVVYTCDHDQIGNRAIGDRPSAYLDQGQLAIKAALVLTSAYTPMLFMGEEWGASTPFQFFTSHPEPELGKATAEGRKAEFADHGWDAAEIPDPQDPETFLRSKLDWSEPGQPDHARLLDFYRALISLRRSVPDLTDDRWDSVSASYDVDRGWFALHRGAVSTICVLGGATTVPIAIEPLLAWEPVDAGDSGFASPGHNVVVGRRLVP